MKTAGVETAVKFSERSLNGSRLAHSHSHFRRSELWRSRMVENPCVHQSVVNIYGSLSDMFICLYANCMYYFSKLKLSYLKACCISFGRWGGRDSTLFASHLHRNRQSHKLRNHKQKLPRLHRRCRKFCFLMHIHFWHLSKCSRECAVPFRK